MDIGDKTKPTPVVDQEDGILHIFVPISRRRKCFFYLLTMIFR